MPDILRETVDYLRAQLGKIDLRLGEIETERSGLVSARATIAVVLDGEAGHSSGVGHAQLTEAPAARATPPASNAATTTVRSNETLMDARRRLDDIVEPSKVSCAILVALSASPSPATLGQIVTAAKFKKHQLKYHISRLVDAGEIVRTGRTHSTRYSLPTGRARRAASVNGNGKGSPADDDAHGAVRDVTSAGGFAGVTPAPVAGNCQRPVSRPSASAEVATMDVLDVDDEPCDALADAVDDVGDEGVEVYRPYRAPVSRPDLRQPRTVPAAAAATKTARESFWLRPDADWQAEAQRMRNDPKAMNVPGQNNILCSEFKRASEMGGAW